MNSPTMPTNCKTWIETDNGLHRWDGVYLIVMLSANIIVILLIWFIWTKCRMSKSEDETDYFKFNREEINRREQLFKVGGED
jgi:hypothetical protein